MNARASALALAFVGVCLAAGRTASADADEEQSCAAHADVVMRAMCDEMERSMRSLQLAELERPYFLSYRVDERHQVRASGHFGALASSNRNKTRSLSIELRVGGPDLDNSNYLPTGFEGSPLASSYRLPLDDDYRELRRQMWTATDSAYKHALETLSKKRAALQNKTREEVPDFLPAQTPHVSRDALAWEEPPVAALETTVRDLGAVFKQLPAVEASWVHAQADAVRSLYINSEGSSYTTANVGAEVAVVAKAQAPDGTVLQDGDVFMAQTWQELPSPSAMTNRVLELSKSLDARRQAAPFDLYNGPVLFEGQAAAALFAQAFAANLLATRVPVTDSRMQGYAASTRNPFLDKIGARVLPRFLNVRDDPTISENDGGALRGGYAVDAEGVPAGPTTLVEHGMLRALLSTRNPVAGISESTGNRRGAEVWPSNLIVTATQGLSNAELRDEFMALVREFGLPYGVVVRRLASARKLDNQDRPSSASFRASVDYLARAFKVYLDGTEEPIRKGELSGFGASAFKDIVAVSQSVSNHDFAQIDLALALLNLSSLRLAGPSYGRALEEPVATISIPDLLFEDATIRRPSQDAPKPPALAHPFFE